MSYTDIDQTAVGKNDDEFQDWQVESKKTDAPTSDTFTYEIEKADEYLGYYKTIPELKLAVDTIARWTVGKGYIAEPFTELVLLNIVGHGKDSFNTILENMIRCYYIYGDSFAEVIRDGKRIINLKPLDPATMRIVCNKKGVIIRYEQYDKNSKEKSTIAKWGPEDIFHLSRNRVADEIHGVSIIEAVRDLIDARNEAIADYRKLLHRNLYPVRLWHLDTDDTKQIASFKQKVSEAKYQGEDIFVPKGNVETELATVPQNSSLDPKAWIQQLANYFYEAVGVPRVVLGGSTEITQTAVQVEYLAWEQTVSESQKYIEDMILLQLDLEIELQFPASLQNNLLSDMRKDGSQQQQLNKPSTLKPSFEQGGQIRGFD